MLSVFKPVALGIALWMVFMGSYVVVTVGDEVFGSAVATIFLGVFIFILGLVASLKLGSSLNDN